MFLKTLLIGFVLRNIKNRNIVLNDSISTNAIPKRQRSYSEEFENSNSSNVIEMNTRNTFFNKNHGYDERYNASKYGSDDDIIFNITKFNRQMELLKKLENKGVSKPDKVKIIEEYNKNENPSPIVPNINEGGLYKDWENVWEYDYKK